MQLMAPLFERALVRARKRNLKLGSVLLDPFHVPKDGKLLDLVAYAVPSQRNQLPLDVACVGRLLFALEYFWARKPALAQALAPWHCALGDESLRR